MAGSVRDGMNILELIAELEGAWRIQPKYVVGLTDLTILAGNRVSVNGVKGRLVIGEGSVGLNPTGPATNQTAPSSVAHGLPVAPFHVDLEITGGSLTAALSARYNSVDATNIVDIRASSDATVSFAVGVTWAAWGFIAD